MLSIHCVSHQLHAGIHLAGIFLIILIQKRRIAADLPQSRQLRQDLDFSFAYFLVTLCLQTLPQLLHMCLIQLLLFPFHPRVNDLLQLFRKLL